MKNIEIFKREIAKRRTKLFTGKIRRKLADMGIPPVVYHGLRKENVNLENIPEDVLCKIAILLDITGLSNYFDTDLIKKCYAEISKLKETEQQIEDGITPPSKEITGIKKEPEINYQEKIKELEFIIVQQNKIIDFLKSDPIEVNKENLQKLYELHLDNPDVVEYKGAFIVEIQNKRLLIKSYYII